MKFQISCNDEDFLAWMIAYNSRPRLKSTCILYRTFAWIMLLSFANALLRDILDNNFSILIAIYLLFIFVMLRYGVDYPKSTTRALVNSLKKEGKLAYHETSIVEFLEDEFSEISDYSMERAKYADITNILQDKEHIYLQIGAMKGLILPIRCLNGQEQELLDFLYNKLYSSKS